MATVCDEGVRLRRCLREKVRFREAWQAAERHKDQVLAREQAARAEAETARQRLAFLAEASIWLMASLNYETTLARLPRLVVPFLADWCVVSAVAAEALLVTMAHDGQHLEMLRALGLTAYMVVPLRARGRTFGAMTCALAHTCQRYSQADLALAEDLSYRAALALDNARLYYEAQEEIARRQRAEAALRQARIFEPFFTTKPLGLGTGLGLPLCLGIIEGHEGTIRLQSAPGQGSVFYIELPIRAEAASEPQAPMGETPPVGGELTAAILIVDDEPGVVRALAHLLRRRGHEVDTATNGRLALAKLQARDYDLILSDLRMPECDGPALYHALQHRQPQLCQRFIFLTGDTLGPEAQAFLEKVSAPRLTKPCRAAQVQQVVQQVLRALKEPRCQSESA
jgi:CheY-like chemotaxis protein